MNRSRPSPGERLQDYTVRFLDFGTGEVTLLLRKEGPVEHSWLAVSPDEDWILCGETLSRDSELILVESFR